MHTDICGDTDYYYTFQCPVCGKETDIPERDVPSSIKRLKLEMYKSGYTRGRRV